MAVSSGWSSSKTALTSAVVIPGSYSSRNASYGESPCSISSAQLQRHVVHAPKRGEEDGKVALLARLEPRDVGLSAFTGPRGRDLGRDTTRLLPFAASDADEARVVGVVAELCLERGELVEQAPDLVRDETLVDDAGKRCRGLRAGGLRPSAASSSADPNPSRRAPARGRRSPPGAASDPQVLGSPGVNLPAARIRAHA